MSLRKNIISNYVAQIYITIIGVIMVPLYIKYMGAEAYGLVGFFAMLQAWFNLLDAGLTPTMARETARFRGGATDALSFRRLVRALEVIFLAIAIIGGTTLFLASDYIAHYWIQASYLPTTEVKTAIQLMAVIIALRWMCGLYRGAISGAEKLIWLAGYNGMIATLRFVGVVLLLMFVSATPFAFFSYQLGIAVLELIILFSQTCNLLPNISRSGRLNLSWSPLKPVLKFSLSVAFTSSVWVFVTQTDKLVLSKILPLSEYGFFTLVVLVANGVMVVSGPVSAAIMPRMTKLEAEGNQVSLIQTYRQSTQLVAILAGAVSITLASCAEPLLWAWTGDRELSHRAAPVLALYASGNGILAMSGFPYYLQYAKGNLRLHLIGNALFVVFLIPLIIWSASQYGSLGAGHTWLGMNMLYFLVWVPLVHYKLAPGLNKPWFTNDVAPIAISCITTGYSLSSLVSWTGNRWVQAGEVILIGVFILTAGFLSSSAFSLKSRVWQRFQQVIKERLHADK